MTVIANSTPMLSSVLMGDSSFLTPDFNYQFHNVKESADTEYKLGQVVVWNGTDAFRILKNTDFTDDTTITSTTSGLKDQAILAVVVGFDSLGSEYSKTVGTTAVKACLLFRGQVDLKENGLVYDAGVVAARVATSKVQLQKQALDVKAVAAQVRSSVFGSY